MPTADNYGLSFCRKKRTFRQPLTRTRSNTPRPHEAKSHTSMRIIDCDADWYRSSSQSHGSRQNRQIEHACLLLLNYCLNQVDHWNLYCSNCVVGQPDFISVREHFSPSKCRDRRQPTGARHRRWVPGMNRPELKVIKPTFSRLQSRLSKVHKVNGKGSVFLSCQTYLHFCFETSIKIGNARYKLRMFWIATEDKERGTKKSNAHFRTIMVM